MPQQEAVSLATIGGGALAELFDAELARILSNITDPNTDPHTKRVMTFTIKFTPNRDRDVADVQLTCGSKLAGIMTVSTQLFVGKHQGKLIAVENDPRQTSLFDADPPVRFPALSTPSVQDGVS
jgi:hypothetical protein